MGETTDKKEYASHFPDEHTMIADLLDAYSTGELEEYESREVEQHLASCQRCQVLLKEIKQLRDQFSSFVENNSSHSFHHLPSVANDVLNQLTQQGGRSMQQQSLIEKQEDKPRASRHWSTNLWGPIAASLLVALLIGSLTIFHAFSQGQVSGQPALIPWKLQQDQVVAQSDGELFEVKYLSITPKDLRIFYVVRSQNRGKLAVQATSISPTGTSTSLTTTIQSLGQLGPFDTGVLHVKIFHLTGQIIELRITPVGKNEPTWKLAPLKQILDEQGEGSQYGFSIQTPQPSGVLWFGPVKEETVAFFKESETKPNASYVFVRFDDASLVKVITQAEYLRIAGKENFR